MKRLIDTPSNITTAELFEGYDISNLSLEEIAAAKKAYNYLIEANTIAKAEGKDLGEIIDEGILSGIIGGIAGGTIGTSIGRALCKCLGIQENGLLGNLLTSRIFLAAMGYELGYSM